MVYKLNPLELSFGFEGRDYELGDTINLRVTITPNRDRGRRSEPLRPRKSHGQSMDIGPDRVRERGSHGKHGSPFVMGWR